MLLCIVLRWCEITCNSKDKKRKISILNFKNVINTSFILPTSEGSWNSLNNLKVKRLFFFIKWKGQSYITVMNLLVSCFSNSFNNYMTILIVLIKIDAKLHKIVNFLKYFTLSLTCIS